MAWNLPESAEIMKLQEVIDSASQLTGKAVRLIAKLDTYDCVKQRATLCSIDRQHNQRFLLDTRFIEPFHARPGSVFQFIGELDSASSNHQPILRARVVRCVDGMDVAMYNKALDAQRKFFKSRETNDAAGSMQT
ncbi:CST complex subunit TEN1-like [Asterias rubens]|uniref:CST complex subunit TEN1-like n=1 Tax=Asterias rubens TaxID=7604 RepID=UPI0014554FE2|nr:CST complex subunit TEN1-like [Asterias rubens]